MRVASITIYPVKSMRGASVAQAHVELAGLRHDRRWMVVDSAGENITARTHHVMLSISARSDDAGGLTLEAQGMAPLDVPTPTGPPDVKVLLSRLPSAVSAGEAADAWLSGVLGESVQLVWLDDPARRSVGISHGGHPGDPLSLADAGPLLLTTTASVQLLSDWIAAVDDDESAKVVPLSVTRFRPSVVIDGDLEPFAEDRWQRVVMGEVEYRFAEHCDRCVMTTIDPETLVTGKEPTRTLAKHHSWDGKVWFGIRLIPMHTGQLRVGDAVSASF
jgi:uncharacterized protein YcbX